MTPARFYKHWLTWRDRFPTKNGDWFTVHILPYRTLEDIIDGVVITFSNITAFKKLEAELRATEAQLRQMLEKKQWEEHAINKKSTSQLSAAELRRQAENKLNKIKKNTTPQAETEVDTQRLIHELQVHQIELEMQNEELVETRGEIEALLRQYTDLYDFAPVGYFTLAPDSTIIKTNLTGAKMLGLERSRLMNRRLGLFVSSKSRLDFNAYLAKLFSTSDAKASSEFWI